MENTVHKIRKFFDEGKLYLTRETPFKDKHSFVKRQEEAQRIREKYPNRIPVICECIGGEVPDIDRKKYLVPAELTMAEFLYVIRKRIKISPEKSIFLFVNDTFIAGAQLMGMIYEEHKDLDGFLYTCYSGENTFG